MNTILKKDRETRDRILSLTKAITDKYYAQKETLPPSRLFNDGAFPDLPQKGMGAISVLEHFQKHYADEMANSAGPRYFGFVTGGSTPASVAGDWLVSVYDQVMSGSNDSAAHF